jgi:hypothetical protein
MRLAMNGRRDSFKFMSIDGTDQHRLCGVNSSRFRVDRFLRVAGAAAPTGWDSAPAQWEVERVWDKLIRLRNASLRLTRPYTERG